LLDGDGPSYTRPTVTANHTPETPVQEPRAERSTEALAANADLIDAAAVRASLARCRRIVERHAAYLTRLDAVLGDGDHGDNLVIGFRAVDVMLAELPDNIPPGELLRAVGHRLVATVGGASGPLYGTAFLEAGARLGESRSLRAADVAAALLAASSGLARRGRCTVGDKTILDTLAPAAERFDQEIDAGTEPAAAFAAAVRAAERGMRSTRPLIARRGLAMRLGDRAIGHLDPGAVSCLLLLCALGGA
jgi:phosphoenolpyruvate---glycerone phosphotransferase subunit DhaL